MRTRYLSWALAGVVILLASLAACQKEPPVTAGPSFEVLDLGIADLQAALTDGRITSRELVERYLTRIQQYDRQLKAIIAVNPHARDDADRLDRERAAGKVRGPLHGIPIVVKDNIDVAGIANTAGSLALVKNVPARDAPLVRRLTDAGAIILAKSNLSEWANIRSDFSTSGWSAVGGLARNPYANDRTACGSSSGSGVAVAASFAAAAIGTETDGSVTCPSAITGVVGLKPTVGLVSRAGIVPISHVQDTAGPMARSVADVATLLTAMAGSDPSDTATRDADTHRTDYSQSLNASALQGARIGVLRFATGYSPPTDKVFDAALEALRAHGATLVDIDTFEAGELGKLETASLLIELKADLNAYLAATPPAVKTRSLAEVIAFNRAEPHELAPFGQELFEQAELTRGVDDAEYAKGRETAQRIAGPDGIDRLLRENDVVALVAPTTGPAWTIDLVNGDHFGGSSSRLPAVAGYPHLTVPMGQVAGLPVGLSFIGPAWSEPLLLSLGYAYEQATHMRKPPVLP
jgi:amidase